MAAKTRKSIHVRWAIRRDMPEVNSFEGKAPVPMQEEARLKHLRSRNCIGMVAEIGERVVGFMMYNLHTKYIDVLRFSVDPDARHQGVGTAMIGKLKAKLTPIRRNRIMMLVPEKEMELLKFLQFHGFNAELPLAKDHFGDQDGILMVYADLPEDGDDA